jgi:hypothetical protein
MGRSTCAFTPLGFEGVSRRGLPAKGRGYTIGGRPCERSVEVGWGGTSLRCSLVVAWSGWRWVGVRVEGVRKEEYT